MSMQLRQIEFVIAAAENGSFRKAAAVLRVQEYAISRQIRELELSLGAPLFDRSPSGVRLNAAGRDFVTRTRRALSHIELARNVVGRRSAANEGELRIGIFSSMASGYLPSLISEFRSRHAGVDLVFIECNPAEHVAAIRKHTTDIAFLTGTKGWADCESRQLWTERVFAALSTAHKLAEAAEIELGLLSHERFLVSEAPPGEEIHDFLIQQLADLGHHPEIHQQSVGRDNLLQLVRLEMGVTLTSEATTSISVPGIAYVPLSSITLPFCAAWSSGNTNPALHRLLELMRPELVE